MVATRRPIEALLSRPGLAGFELLRTPGPTTAPGWVLEATCADDAREARPDDIVVAGSRGGLDGHDELLGLASACAARGACALAIPADMADAAEAPGSLTIVTYPAWMPRHRAAEHLALALAQDRADELRAYAPGHSSDTARPEARSAAAPSRRVLAVSASRRTVPGAHVSPSAAAARINDRLPAHAEAAPLDAGQADEGLLLLRIGQDVAPAEIRRSLRAAAIEDALSIGASDAFGPGDPTERYVARAREALTLGSALFGGGHVSFYENLYLYKAFIDDGRPELLLSFSRDTLSRLREWDERHGSELLRTVEAFFEQDRNVRRTAERLGIHRHTLRSRLERIEEVTACPVRGEGGMSFELLLAYKHLSKVKL